MTRPTGGTHGDERCADHNTECIRTDDMSGSGYGNPEIFGDMRQQSHHDELARTDAEAAKGKS
jgi:hypothetical protein